MVHRFEAIIKKHEGINATYIEIPFDVEKAYGAKRVKVLAYFDGAPYRGSIVKMGGCFMLGLTQEIRAKIGKNVGDCVLVSVQKDEEERAVELPDDLMTALSEAPIAAQFFKSLSYSKKKDYVQWITGAKREETRRERVRKAVTMLSEGKNLK